MADSSTGRGVRKGSFNPEPTLVPLHLFPPSSQKEKSQLRRSAAKNTPHIAVLNDPEEEMDGFTKHAGRLLHVKTLLQESA